MTRFGLGTVAAICVAAAVATGGCGDDDDSSGSGGGGGGGEASTNVGLALTGPKNDRGFYQSAYEGLVTATKANNYNDSVVDNLEDPQDRLEAMKNLSADNELVIGGGAEFIDAATTLAPQFPDVEYVVLTGVTDGKVENVHAYVPRQGVPAYIAGAVGAELSKSNHVGFVGGLEIPPTEASDKAFEAGAEAQKQGVKYSATTVGTFNDPAKAKEAAKAQIAAGADQLFAFLDAGTPGVVQAIEESGKDVGVFAAIASRCEESKHFVGTTILDVSRVVEIMAEDFEAGSLPKGTRFYGVEKPDVQRFELCPDYETPDLQKLVDDLTKKLDADEIDLPDGV
jgi:basic membrane protein A